MQSVIPSAATANVPFINRAPDKLINEVPFVLSSAPALPSVRSDSGPGSCAAI